MAVQHLVADYRNAFAFSAREYVKEFGRRGHKGSEASSDLHDFLFLQLKQMIHLLDVFVGQLLNIILSAA